MKQSPLDMNKIALGTRPPSPPRCLPKLSPPSLARQEAAAVAADAAQSPADHPQCSNPVEAFPMDTDVRREIGAAVDTEMHRELGATVAAATAAPAAALHPDVAAIHKKVAAEEKVEANAEATAAAAAAVTGVPAVNFDDSAASYASFSNMELLRYVFVFFLLVLVL